jgi:riboflavin kinase/FMN adenylyltransferase
METVLGRERLGTEHGPAFVVVGVFDGIHRGHAYLLEQLVAVARERNARPTVITFDAHPDAVLTGNAPPLLMDPEERLERLASAGIETVVIEHFDDALRLTPYDVFVRGITTRCSLTGFLMTPDAAFGHERAGTPARLAALGDREGFDVVVVPPFALDGRDVRSSEIRTAIATGDLAEAERLLGRPYAVTGDLGDDGELTVSMPVALPPPGRYRTSAGVASVHDGMMEGDLGAPGRVRIEFRSEA